MAEITDDPPDNSEDDRDEKVGYRKPPRAHRFRPGQSGNPRGRRKDTRNFKTHVRDELETKVTLTVNGKRSTLTKVQGIATQLVNSALKGHLKSIEYLVRLIDVMDGAGPATEDSQSLTDEQRKVLLSYLTPPEETGENDETENGDDELE